MIIIVITSLTQPVIFIIFVILVIMFLIQALGLELPTGHFVNDDFDDNDELDDDYVDDDDDVDDKDYNDDVEDDDGEDYRQATFETLLYCPLSLLYVLKVLREMYKSCFKKCDLQFANHAESS